MHLTSGGAASALYEDSSQPENGGPEGIAAPAPGMIFRAREFEFVFPRAALVMGILNVTPDSFSDGGRFLDADKAVARALELAAQGADILDIGGESTRPGASPVAESEELGRVVPVIQRLSSQMRVPISIDTMKPAVARAALEAGASIVNDVAAAHRATGLPTRAGRKGIGADEMWGAVANFKAGYVCMHMQGMPRTMQDHPVYADIVSEVAEFFRRRTRDLRACGVEDSQILFDPGIGFGKTLEHNLQLLNGLRRFTSLRRPLMLGVSRKSFMGGLLDVGVQNRLPASLACACMAVAAGAHVIRTHDVAETVQAVRMTEAILARKQI